MNVRITQSFPNSLLGEAVAAGHRSADSTGEEICVA